MDAFDYEIMPNDEESNVSKTVDEEILLSDLR